nr:type IX secretion system membrane protein PorP/SprF [Chitinophagaceae bacterium]
MKKIIYILTFALILLQQKSNSQGLHFSQFYNAPILLNPANTGIIANGNWRAGGNYRTQWFTIPVPYN